MQKKKIILLAILILIILSIALLILNAPKQTPQPLTEQAKANYTTQIGTQTYDITNAVLEPTGITPAISAGMIPIKWNGANFVITTFEDTNWYDYANGKPAYIMLNDGYYKSELIQGITEEQLMENAVGNDALVVPNVPNNNPTIYMYIPRFAYNAQGEILYIKQSCSVAGTYTMPEVFSYETEKRDFSLAGIWVEYTPLENTSTVNTKINNMTGENNQYGFIANTIATNANNETLYKNIMETYNQYITNIVNGTTGASFPTDSTTDTNTVGAPLAGIPEGHDTAVPITITDISNQNRTILKITNTNQPEPIKAHGYYDETEEKIKIEVINRTNAIAKILNSKGKILSENSLTADTGDEIIGNKVYKYMIIDNLGNIKAVSTEVSGLDIYIIENEDDLKLFRDAVNTNKTTANTKAYQIADVKMNEGKYTIDEDSGNITFAEDAEQWMPIGKIGSQPYIGKYYGNSYSISGIYINGTSSNQALFANAASGTNIQDLNLINSSIKGSQNVSGIVAQVNGAGTIGNCSFSGNIVATSSKSYAGGIVAYVSSAQEVNITNCSANGIIEGKDYVGGIVGYVSQMRNDKEYTIKLNIDSCNNNAYIKGSNNVGGIISEIPIYTYGDGYNIINCSNNGDILGVGFVGGIMGNLRGTDTYHIGKMGQLKNTGNIQGTGNYIGRNSWKLF